MQNAGTLSTWIDALSREPSERAFLVKMEKEDAERRSYEHLADRVRRLARGLRAAGAAGERAIIFAPNSPEWICACLGIIRSGAAAVPLDTQLGEEALAHILRDSDPGWAFTSSDHAAMLAKVSGGKFSTERPAGKEGSRLLLLDSPEDDERNWLRLEGEDGGELPDLDAEDAAALFYTSGTTGRPKGVPLTHRNLVFQLESLRKINLIGEDDAVLLPLPLHHVYPFTLGMLAPLDAGAAIILPQSLTGPELLRASREGGATAILGVPRLYRALHDAIEGRAKAGGLVPFTLFRIAGSASRFLLRRLGMRLGKFLLRPVRRRFGGRLRLLASGGSALDPDLAWKLEAIGWRVISGYGLTETSPLLAIQSLERARIGTVGRPLPGVEIRIDPSSGPSGGDGNGSAQEGEGEILARGPGVFAGYRNLPEETRRVLAADGWFRTGDLGRFDREGDLRVLGRIGSLIVSESGENIDPEEVEEAYQEHPAIKEIGVLDVDDHLAAVIVPEREEISGDDAGDARDRIRRAVEERSRKLPSHHRIADFALSRRALERTRLGKLRRHLLPRRYEESKKRAQEPRREPGRPLEPQDLEPADRRLVESPGGKKVWELLRSRFPDRRIEPDASPGLDLGIDSMEWVNLTLEIRRQTGVELDDEAIRGIETVRDLLRAVAEREGEGESAAASDALFDDPEALLADDQKRWLKPPGPFSAAAEWILLFVIRALMRIFFRLRVEGLDRLPESGNYILAPNHASYLDPFALAAALGYRRLWATWWAGWTGAAFGNPLTRLLSRIARAVPIDPDRAALSSLAFGAALLRRGDSLVWFPEGRRSETGELQPFQPGIGKLLKLHDVPAVPVWIRGTHSAMLPGRKLPRLKRIEIIFGDPVRAGELAPEDGGDRGAGEGEENGKSAEERREERIAAGLRERVRELGSPRFTAKREPQEPAARRR